jgi:hypothetical protein
VRLRPKPGALNEAPITSDRPEEEMANGHGGRGLRADDFRVTEEARPGWVRGTVRPPQPGEEVYCAGGAGTVSAVHGKTGDGSRLLQIRLATEAAPPFFAAASNVLVMPA